jgi:hypothetical protein
VCLGHVTSAAGNFAVACNFVRWGIRSFSQKRFSTIQAPFPEFATTNYPHIIRLSWAIGTSLSVYIMGVSLSAVSLIAVSLSRVPQVCPSGVSFRCVLQVCPSGVSFRCVPQVCPHKRGSYRREPYGRVSHRHVPHGCALHTHKRVAATLRGGRTCGLFKKAEQRR